MKTRYFLLTIFSAFITCCVFSQQTITYYDSTRQRKLVAEIWVPQSNQAASFPLIMFSHGTGGNRRACSWFCKGLADKGYMVAAVDHFGNTFDNPIPKEFVSIWQRPQDISLVLSALLKDEKLGPKIDAAKIGMAGFSIGGYTSFALAGAKLDWNALIQFLHTPEGYQEVNVPEMPGLATLFEQEDIIQGFKQSPDLWDKRIKAIFVMAPAAGQGFPAKKDMKRVEIPVFIVGAASDSIAPIKTNALHYKKLLPKAEWFLIDGLAGHYVFLNEGTPELQKAAPIFFKDAESVNRAEIHAQVVSKAAVFFNKLFGGK